MVEHIVYILGAGTSYDAGGPLIKDFFSRNGRYDHSIYPRRFDNNSRYLILESIYSEWSEQNDNPNIEAFFQKMEFYQISGKKFEDPNTGQLYDPELIERYLVWYIASYVRHSITAQRNPPHYYRDFVKKLKKRGVRSSVLSFNYDLVIDNLIRKEFHEFNYGLGKIKGSKLYSDQKGVPLYKLHGSLNWLVCDECGKIYISDKSRAHIFNRSRCDYKRCKGYLNPYIVPPSPSKGKFFGIRNALWVKARRKLEKADKIVIIGYSLPPLDIQAKELIKDGAQTTGEVIIVNRNPQVIEDISGAIGRPDIIGINEPMHFKDYVVNRM